MKHLLFFIFLLFSGISLAQEVRGTITDEDDNRILNALVYNISAMKYASVNPDGTFLIQARVGDELRIAKKGFDRTSYVVSSADLTRAIDVHLVRTPKEIEEVHIQKVKLTGELDRDSKMLAKSDRVEQLQNEIGVPKTPEKPREATPPSVQKVGVLGYALSNLNLNTLYKNISGDGRRMKSVYRYEDLQENVHWIRERIEDDYFIKAGIPQEKIEEFIRFSIGKNPNISQSIQAGNFSAVLFVMEEDINHYLNQIK